MSERLAWSPATSVDACQAGPLSCWPGVDALIVSTDNAMT